MKKVVLFDIDGTLLRADGAGREAIGRAMARVYGVSIAEARAASARIDFRGATDSVLLREIAAGLGLHIEGLDSEVVGAYLEELDDTLAQSNVTALPGVPELVSELSERSDVITGLLTGNVRAAAVKKLSTIGLAYLATAPGGFGDDAIVRDDIARVAHQRAISAGGDDGFFVVVGDTLRDIQAARAIGARAVAVATGWTPMKDLVAAGPDLVCTDLSEPRQLWAMIASLS